MSIKHFDTLQVHAGRDISASNSPCVTPICQTSSFLFDSTEHAASLFALSHPGHIYTRLSNPTTDVLEKRVAALEGAAAAVAVSSGQASQFLAIQNIASAGDNIVSATSLYGGTHNQFKISFKRLGIEFRFAPNDNIAEFESKIDNKTKAIFIETIGNSDFYIPEFEAFAELSKKYEIPLIVDNTFGAAGYLFRPIDYGAAVITHAATKWIGGHGTSIGGIVVDCGNFNWANGKFPQFTQPSESYHGLSFWESFGEGSQLGNIAFAVKARAEGLRDWGCSLSPFNSFLIQQGCETLSLRMDKIVGNALELAQWLESHPKVESVNYPGLKNNPNHQRAKKYLKNGFGGVLTFTLKASETGKNGRPSGKTPDFVHALELISHLVNVGDNKTLISHSASTTHAQLSKEELERAGIGENMLRVSLGIENIGDLKADIEQALRRI
jgi:O-acetylhomoserine (thiol)-lyase